MNLKDKTKTLELGLALATAKRELILLELAKLNLEQIELREQKRKVNDLLDRKVRLEKMTNKYNPKPQPRFYARVAHFG